MQKELIKSINFKFVLKNEIILLIEPSEEYWNVEYDIVSKILDRYYGEINKFYFLGVNKRFECYTADEFLTKLSGNFQRYKNRISTIGPIIEELEAQRFEGLVLVISSKQPVDYIDFIDTEWYQRIIFIKIGNEDFEIDFEGINYYGINSIEALRDILNNPVEEIIIKGNKEFVPIIANFSEDNQFKSDILFEDGFFKIKIHTKNSFTIYLIAYCEELPSMYVKREKTIQVLKGEEERLLGENFEWFKIPEEIIPIIRAGIEKKDFKCIQCGKMHKYSTLVCPEGMMILRGFPDNTCILLKEKEYYPLSSQFAYVFENRRVITNKGEIYDWKNEEYKYIKNIEPYEEVDDEIWAIYNRT